MQQIEIRVISGNKAVPINYPYPEEHYTITEIALGVGSQRRSIKYPKDFIKPETECKAVIIAEGKIRIV